MIDYLNNNKECNEIIIDILKILILEGIYHDYFDRNKKLIEKAKEIDKSLIYILMRNQKSFDLLSYFIDNELKNIDIYNIINEYSK